MFCKNCGKEFFKEWRKSKKAKGRALLYCSFKCSRVRELSEDAKNSISLKIKEAWEEGVFAKILHTHNFTDEDRKKASKATTEKQNKINENYIKLGLYEKLGNKIRRKILLKEVNYTCEVCHNDKWLSKPIWLEVHHKDDDNKNNKRDNLLIVCPNCHSVIDEKYRFKGRKHTE